MQDTGFMKIKGQEWNDDVVHHFLSDGTVPKISENPLEKIKDEGAFSPGPWPDD
jgi:hypothetical protein